MNRTSTHRHYYNIPNKISYLKRTEEWQVHQDSLKKNQVPASQNPSLTSQLTVAKRSVAKEV
jgi:hypothetical protein